mgnify:CR=1 FL=1
MQRQSTRRSFMGMAAGLGALAPAAVFKSAVADEKAGPPARAFGLVADYYPHWATREGALPDAVLSALAVGTVIGVHHETTIDDIERLLSFPEKRFRIAWYAESNLQESEDAAPLGLPLAVRITEAGMRQAWLASRHGADRFADLIERVRPAVVSITVRQRAGLARGSPSPKRWSISRSADLCASLGSTTSHGTRLASTNSGHAR